jgi:hypothetical protein
VPRDVASIIKAALLAQNTEASFWVLLELSHETLATPLRFCDNNEEVTRLGVVWSPASFSVTLPNETPDELAKVALSFPNLDRTVLDALRALDTPLSVRIYVAASTDEAMLAGPFEFAWREFSYDAATINASLESEDILNQSYPKDEFIPSRFAGLFR